MLMPLDRPLDWRRYGAAVLHLLIAAAATRFSAERDAFAAVGGLLFWCLVFGVCSVLRVRRPAGAASAEHSGNLAAGFGLLGFLFKLSTAGLLPALAFLLMASQAALLLLAERRQQLWLLLAASLAAVLFAAAESRSALFLPCAAWYALAALSLLYRDRAEELATRAQGQLVEPPAPGHGAAVFAAFSLLLALPLYLWLPKPPALALGGMTAQSAHDYAEHGERDPHGGEAQAAAGDREAAPAGEDGEDAAEELDIQAPRRERALANDILMFVDSSAPVNLRGALLDRFEHNRWRRSPMTAQRHELQRGYYERAARPGDAPSLRQRIELVANLERGLPVAPGVLRLRFPAPALDEYPDGSWATLQPLRAPTLYSVEATPQLLGGRYLLPEATPPDLALYLQLPTDLSPRIRGLAAELTRGIDDPLEQALALEQHLRRGYQYSFDTVLSSQGVTPLDEFLFQTRRGHCEYFASALAVLLRSVGIPARLATGYALGERNPLTGYYEVRRLQGHAWVEAWLPQRGWLMLEPTPFYPLPQPAGEAQVAAELDRYLEQRASQAAALDPDALRSQLLGVLRDGWKLGHHLLRQLAAALSNLLSAWPLLLLAAGLLLPGVYLLPQWRADRAEQRRARALLTEMRAGEAGGVLAAAEGLELVLGARGRPRAAGTPFTAYYAALCAAGLALPPDFGGVFNRHRYAQGAAPLDTEALRTIATLLATELDAQPYPRLGAQLRAWRQRLEELARGLRLRAG